MGICSSPFPPLSSAAVSLLLPSQFFWSGSSTGSSYGSGFHNHGTIDILSWVILLGKLSYSLEDISSILAPTL